MKKLSVRIPYWDNLKGFLIFLVVFGHLLQLVPNGCETALYKLIYLFHMPLFIFCSGALSSFSPRKILKGLILPYVLLQIICCFCTGEPIQLITPYWMLWYLPALAVWRTCLPLLDCADRKAAPFVVLLLLLLGCSAGFIDAIGYTCTLSRILVFAPYFAIGYYAKKYNWFRPDRTFSATARLSFAAAALVLCIGFIMLAPIIQAKWLYGAYGYSSGGYGVFFRIAQYAGALVIGFSILVLIPNVKTFFTAWGTESFVLYIAHIALLPAIRGILPVFSDPSQYAVCMAATLLFCAGVPWIKVQAVHLKW